MNVTIEFDGDLNVKCVCGIERIFDVTLDIPAGHTLGNLMTFLQEHRTCKGDPK